MKKIILTVCMAGAMMAVKAQDKPVQKNTSAEVTTQLKQDLQLNDQQYQQMQQVTDKRMERRKEIEAMYSSDPTAREAKIHEADMEADAELSKVLSEKQYNAYLELQGRGTAVPVTTETGATKTQVNVDVQEGTKTKIESGKVKTETGKQETKAKGDEMKMKDGNHKMKSDHEKTKVDHSGEKIKVEDNKVKYESNTEEMKVRKDEEKYKSGETKYKSEPGKTKMQQGDDKAKVKGDKAKSESKNSRIVTDKDKTVIKSGDSKYKMKQDK